MARRFCSQESRWKTLGLGEVAHAEAGPLEHGLAGDLPGVEEDPSVVGVDHADGHSEAGGLAGAVAAEEADDLGPLDMERDAVDDGSSGVELSEVLGLEEGHAGSVGKDPGRPGRSGVGNTRVRGQPGADRPIQSPPMCETPQTNPTTEVGASPAPQAAGAGRGVPCPGGTSTGGCNDRGASVLGHHKHATTAPFCLSFAGVQLFDPPDVLQIPCARRSAGRRRGGSRG